MVKRSYGETDSVEGTIATLKVAVTTGNPEKLAAVTESFSSHFPGTLVQTTSCPSESGIPHGQPWGVQHTYEGAAARLHHLKTSSGIVSTDFQYLVSVENGVVGLLSHSSTSGLDVACVVIECVANGRQAMNISQSRPYPLERVQQMKRAGTSNEDIGKFCKKWYEDKRFPLSRKEQIKSSIAFALAELSTPDDHMR
eukprot:TRINITY_DN14562_c0_g2_i1.p1 TRINITY_DN14562_c0_g2~~TRINITY_DN14562_c0_g2_i1.p1  ORF type:complete len:197 (+),score=21.55 TRINITY_DN14562_c0_g2_i1:62-652(+)